MKLFNVFEQAKETEVHQSDTRPVIDMGLDDDSEDFGILETVNELIYESEAIQENLYYSFYTHNMVTVKEDTVSDVVVMEGFSDFMEGARRIIRTLIDKIKEIYRRVIMWVSSRMTSTSKFIKKYRKDILNLGEDFTYSGYRYTINTEIPSLSFITDLVSEYNEQISNVTKINPEYVNELLNDYNEEEFGNVIRGNLLDRSPIDSDQFKNILFTTFRDGSEHEVSIDINKGTIRAIIDSYDELVKTKKKFEKERNRMIVFLNDFERFFARGAKMKKSHGSTTATLSKLTVDIPNTVVGDGDVVINNMNVNTATLISTLYSIRYQESTIISSNTLLALNEKMGAIKEQINQTELIIRESLKYKRGGN